MQEEELGRVGGPTDHKVRQLRRAQRCVGVAAGARVERGRGGQRVRVVLDDGRCARPDSGVHGRSWGGVLERGGEVAEPAAGGHGLRGFAAPGVKSAKRFSGLLVCCLEIGHFRGKSRSRKKQTRLRSVQSGLGAAPSAHTVRTAGHGRRLRDAHRHGDQVPRGPGRASLTLRVGAVMPVVA
jgi:hypothetical protein